MGAGMEDGVAQSNSRRQGPDKNVVLASGSSHEGSNPFPQITAGLIF